jgi:hypothetical protein
MIRLRAPGNETEQGIVEIIDPAKPQLVGSFNVNRYPAGGCFNTAGTEFYQPYWGENFIDIIDTVSHKSIARIGTPMPLSKLVVLGGGMYAVGISTETDSLLIVDLAGRNIEKIIKGIPTPKDVVACDDRFALVCSYGQARIYELDVIGKHLSGEIETSPRPTRLIISPQKNLIISVHQLSRQIDIFGLSLSKGSLSLVRNKTLDLGEVIADGTFVSSSACYFVGSGKSRIFGLDIWNGKTLWAMRTGGVRARNDVEKVLYVGE